MSAVRNRLEFFNRLDGLVRTPDYTQDQDIAKSWINSGKKVIAHYDIDFWANTPFNLIEDLFSFLEYNHKDVAMYTKYVSKKDEYRVHVVGDEVNLVQLRTPSGVLPKKYLDYKVRLLENGFTFDNEDITAPDDVLEQAVKAVQTLGSEGGIVDVLWSEYTQEAYVLNIHVAPDLSNQKGEDYLNAIGTFEKVLSECGHGRVSAMRKKKKSPLKKGMIGTWTAYNPAQVLIDEGFNNVDPQPYVEEHPDYDDDEDELDFDEDDEDIY